MQRLPLLAAACTALLALPILQGCLYNHRYVESPLESTDGFKFHVVQADDYGSFWQSSDAVQTLAAIDEASKRTNVVVVLFIHGWDHNASSNDPNLLASRGTLSHLYGLLDSRERRQLRSRLTNDPNFELHGIYIGWRGKSLPDFFKIPTFWDRKATAEVVGQGDLFEFIKRLQLIYTNANAKFEPTASASAKASRRFMGLVTIGHSFGAQVLWKSLDHSLETPLIEQTAASTFSDTLAPRNAPHAAADSVPISTLGDLNILLNPALEAYQFARVDKLYPQMRFDYRQTPQLVIFSADNDDARKTAFPIGRFLTGPFRPNFRNENDRYQAQLWTKALGEVDEQVTHTLSKKSGATDSLTDDVYQHPEVLDKSDFTDRIVFNGIELAPAPHSVRVPYSPVLVIRSTDKIIDGHNGIFGENFITFLSSYIAFIEGKRLLLRERNEITTAPLQTAKASAQDAAAKASAQDAAAKAGAQP